MNAAAAAANAAIELLNRHIAKDANGITPQPMPPYVLPPISIPPPAWAVAKADSNAAKFKSEDEPPAKRTKS